jgi:hypothetical protein
MYPPTQTIETKVAILEEKIHTTDQLMQRIDSAIEKLSEVNANVTKMLIVHEEKISIFINNYKKTHTNFDDFTGFLDNLKGEIDKLGDKDLIKQEYKKQL